MFKYINFLLLAILLLIFSCDEELKPVIEGCTIETACNYNADATDNDDSCVFEEGCNQWCNGDEGEPQEFDCAFTCDGSAVEDNCGTCDNDSSNDCVQDCSNDWGGSKEEDVCGVCGGTGIPFGECDCAGNVIDCAGVCDGDAVEDDCGTCGGSITDIDDCDFDCEGVPGGSAIIDECDVCGGDGIPNGECDCAGNVKDCAGVCDGDAVEDDCGDCAGINDCFGCNDWYMENFICDDIDATDKCCVEDDNNNDNRCKINGTGIGCNVSACQKEYIMECDICIPGSTLSGWDPDPTCSSYCDYDGAATGDPCSTSEGSFSEGEGLCIRACNIYQTSFNGGSCSNLTCPIYGEYCDYVGAEVGTPCSTAEGSIIEGEGLCVLNLSDDVWYPTDYITYYDSECADGTDDCCTEPTCDEPFTLSLEYIDASTLQVNYSSTEAIGGFQFDIDGAIVTGASGGDFDQSITPSYLISLTGNNSLVVGYVFGGSFPAGSGTLTNLNIDTGESTQLCLQNVTIGDPLSNTINSCPKYWHLTCIPIP